MSIENNEYLLISWLLKAKNQSEFMNICSECVVSNWECEYCSAIHKTDSGSSNRRSRTPWWMWRGCCSTIISYLLTFRRSLQIRNQSQST